jgi:hypothetical protein
VTEQKRGVGARGWAAAAAAAAVAALLGARCHSSDPPEATARAPKAAEPAPAKRPDRPGRRSGARPRAPEAPPTEDERDEDSPIVCALSTRDPGPHPPLEQLRVETPEGPAGPPLLVEALGPEEWAIRLPAAWGRGEDLPGDRLMQQVAPARLRLVGPTTLPLELSLRDGACVAAPLRFQAPQRCPLKGLIAAKLAEANESGLYAIRPNLPHRIEDGRLLLWPSAAAGEAQLHLPDDPPIALRWTEEGCAAPRLRPFTQVDGWVQDPLGGAGPRFVEGCETSGRADPDGRFFLRVAADRPCQLEAYRMDGSLRALSEPVAIDPTRGATTGLTLVLPEEEMAGLGMAFRSLPEGIVAVQVYPDTPAYEAGLRPGDLILEVDGQATAGMSDNDFIAFATGPAGTSVRLLVEDSEGERSTADIRRAAVSR